jgi:glutamate synthase (NADPH/NADH) small chain
VRDWSILSKEFLKDEDGNLRAIHAVRLEWNGSKFNEVPGSDFEMPAERVYLAMGFLHPEHNLLDQLGVEKDERGNAKADPKNYATSVKGVFAAGDMRRGQSLVVWAISEGRECARSVDAFLSGHTSHLESKNHSFAEAAA